MCNTETAMDILWSTTIAGTTIKKHCFGNQIGTYVIKNIYLYT